MSRNQNHQSGKKINPPIAVSISLSKTRVLKEWIGQLAERLYDNGFSDEQMQPGWLALDTSTIEAYTNGTITLIKKSRVLVLPFYTLFLFTCLKTKGNPYTMTWVNSLS